ncbi:MAG: Crp/Fnr family transcriptional regulator [Pseudomonadota bacterium]
MTPEAAREILWPLMTPIRFGDGAFIHGPDGGSDRFFWIEAGEVRFSHMTEDGDEVEFFVLGPDNCFGDISIFSGRPPPHLAHAKGSVALRSMSGARLRKEIGTNAALLDWLLQHMSSRLHTTLTLISILQAQNNRERVWSYISWLAGTSHATTDEEGRRILSLTQGELATRLGMSRGTVATALKALEKQGAIMTIYGKIAVIVTDISVDGLKV